MARGYMGKEAWINLSTGSIEIKEIDYDIESYGEEQRDNHGNNDDQQDDGGH